MKKTIICLFFLSAAVNCYAQGAIQQLESALTSQPKQLHAWETDFTKEKWIKILNACHERNVSNSSKIRLQKILSDNGALISNNPEGIREELVSYCMHAFSTGVTVGVAIEATPLNPGNQQSVYVSENAEACYSIMENGFSDFLEENIRVAAMAAREMRGQGKAQPLTKNEAAIAYLGWCNAVMTKSEGYLADLRFY